MIQYYKHHQIDYERWDKTIENSTNGLVYALSWYLDIVSPGWEALIEDDYNYVMPLPVKHKFYLPYLVQPIFTQQLGIFSAQPVDENRIHVFLEKIPKKFLRCNINLNSKNPILPSKNIALNLNYELFLNKSYQELYSGFNENTRRNIKKAQNHNLSIIENSSVPFIKNYQKYAHPTPNDININYLNRIIKKAELNKSYKLYLVQESNEYIAGAFFLITLNRIIYLTSFSSEEGKKKSGMFLLFDHLIKKYAQSGMVFDFEGSIIPGIARFFEGFGPTRSFYPAIRKNLQIKVEAFRI